MQLRAILFINNCKNTLHVFSTPDDGRSKRPKHVECSCSC